MPAIQESRKICFERGLSASSVGAKGFSDVALITGGVEAAGHGIFVDEESINGLMGLLMGKTLPGYLTHEGAIFSDRLTKEIGLFSGFYRDGLKIKAKQFSFLNSFVKNCADSYETLMELADKVPDQFGLSVVFGGDAVWPCEDGDEVDGDLPRPENCNAAMPSIRFKSIESCDFVKAPAANPDGLFQTKTVDAQSEGMDASLAAKHTEALAVKDAEMDALSASHKTALEKQLADHTAALAKKDEEHKAALAAKEGEISTLKAAHAEAISGKEKEIVELKKFDAREHGSDPANIVLGAGDGLTAMPEPAAKDHQRWEQYEALKAKSPKLAEQFRAKFLSGK